MSDAYSRGAAASELCLVLKGFAGGFSGPSHPPLRGDELLDIVLRLVLVPAGAAAAVRRVVWDGDELRSDSYTAELPAFFALLRSTHNPAVQFHAKKAVADPEVAVISAAARRALAAAFFPDLEGASGGLVAGEEQDQEQGGCSTSPRFAVTGVKVDRFLQEQGARPAAATAARSAAASTSPAVIDRYAALGVLSMQQEVAQLSSSGQLVVLAQGGGAVVRREYEWCCRENVPSVWFVVDLERVVGGGGGEGGRGPGPPDPRSPQESERSALLAPDVPGEAAVIRLDAVGSGRRTLTVRKLVIASKRPM